MIPPPARRWRPTSWVIAIAIGALLAESGAALLATTHPSLGLSVEASSAGSQGLDARFHLSGGWGSLQVHLALVPGSGGLARDPTVLVFADPHFNPLYAGAGDVFGVGTRLSAYLSWMSPSDVVTIVGADALASALAAHPHAYLLMIGTGVIPSALLSRTSSVLAAWIYGGGVLIWAGGPLGYSEGHTASGGGFVYTSLNWSGQQRLVGFALTDPRGASGLPAASGPMPTAAPSAGPSFDQALGITYTATVYGANVTEVDSHGGVALGAVVPGVQGEGPKTSLAWVPVGAGGVFYFGGGVFSPSLGYIPGASVDLCDDSAMLVASGYRPVTGPVAWANVTVGPFAHVDAALQVNDRSLGVLGLARSDVHGGVLFAWHGALAGPGGQIIG